jgi:hypothetical protein
MVRGTLQNLLLTLISVLVTLVLIEIGLRVVGRSPSPQLPAVETEEELAEDGATEAAGDAARARNMTPRYDPSPRLGWHLHPDTTQVFRLRGEFDTTVRSNQLGFRGPPLGPRPDDVVRYVVIGDSYAFGWGVEEDSTYAAQLERLLEASAADDQRFEVVNAALPGFGTFQRLRALESILPLGVDAVIAEFSASNDVVDDWRAAPYVPDELERYQREGTRFPALELFLARHSRLVALVRKRTMPLRLWLECRRQANLERTRELWADLIGRCRGAGLDLVILSNPARSQVVEEGEGMRGALARTRFSHRPNAMIAEVAAEHGVPLIDGADLFAGIPPEELFLGSDPHWTPAGHRLVARALLGWAERHPEPADQGSRAARDEAGSQL